MLADAMTKTAQVPIVLSCYEVIIKQFKHITLTITIYPIYTHQLSLEYTKYLKNDITTFYSFMNTSEMSAKLKVIIEIKWW